ncbi:hypothetical protein ERJ75_001142200 [Trypanosoma vivax]|nr:hypothetical protein ERJ75_001142200 [Trypanosoma vivax]
MPKRVAPQRQNTLSVPNPELADVQGLGVHHARLVPVRRVAQRGSERDPRQANRNACQRMPGKPHPERASSAERRVKTNVSLPPLPHTLPLRKDASHPPLVLIFAPPPTPRRRRIGVCAPRQRRPDPPAAPRTASPLSAHVPYACVAQRSVALVVLRLFSDALLARAPDIYRTAAPPHGRAVPRPVRRPPTRVATAESECATGRCTMCAESPRARRHCRTVVAAHPRASAPAQSVAADAAPLCCMAV